MISRTCDHEEIWVAYDPHTEAVTNVLTFFHSSVIESQAAVQEAKENDGRPIVRIEWENMVPYSKVGRT